MKMTISHVHAENCFGIKLLDTDMYSRTEITGVNGAGKSTVPNIIRWILTNKLSDGREVVGIRPHDDNGVDVDYVDIIGILDVDVDGVPYQFKKTQKQKWVKKRGSEDKRFEGNITEYEINGIPKREADYNAFIYSLADQDTILYGMNGQALLRMDTKKMREKLLGLEPDFTDADVIATDPERYGFLERELKVGSLDELITRSKKIIKEKKKLLDSIPTRIDEVRKMMLPADTADKEAELAEAKKDLGICQGIIDDASGQLEDYDILSNNIMQLRLDKNGLIAELNKENSERRTKLSSAVADERHALQSLKMTADYAKRDAVGMERTLSGITQNISGTRERLDAVKATTFDEHKLVCPTCGQKYTKTRQEKIRSKFEEEKKTEVEKLCKAGNDAIAEKKKVSAELAKKHEEIKALEKEINERTVKIASLEAELNGLPTSVDVSGNPEVVAFDEKIADAEKRLEEQKNLRTNIGEFRTKARVFERKIDDIQQEIKRIADTNAGIQKRIDDLTAEQKETSQMILDQEKLVDILESFNRARIDMLTERINKHFSIVKWTMFRQQINGGWQAVCEPMVDGTSYFGTLNASSKLLAELDIARAFQDRAGVNLPMFLDNAEGVDPDRRMDFGRQLIMMVRTDGKELKVKQA